ncbi:hypothetical protein [Thalassobacillus sp. CUG 92003]|uniref:hypothetical protein n=1 Tax=Thalassobacillus sp. CUG 92003 TaxID=2736641 RepID=UPI0015E74A87|nr:hypothetical protein [Thalassobacillus sp. CUG 92003]
MAKITQDGITIEGSVEELREMGFEFEQSEYKTEKRPAKVGERILITKADRIDGQTHEDGDVLTVTETHACARNDVHVAEQPEFIDFKEYEVIVGKDRQPELKPGDYAKVITEETEKLRKGDIVKVTKNAGRAYDFRCYLLDDSEDELFHAGDLTPATDEEVAEAKRKAAEHRREKIFTDAGRKVDEYREGDVVRFTESTGSEYGEGDTAIVGEVMSDGDFHFDGYHGEPSWCVPVVFVENRLDN